MLSRRAFSFAWVRAGCGDVGEDEQAAMIDVGRARAKRRAHVALIAPAIGSDMRTAWLSAECTRHGEP